MLEWMKPAVWLISVVYAVIGSPLAPTLLASMSRDRRAALSNFLRRVHLLMADRRFHIPYRSSGNDPWPAGGASPSD